jgi:hypothetical protein
MCILKYSRKSTDYLVASYADRQPRQLIFSLAPEKFPHPPAPPGNGPITLKRPRPGFRPAETGHCSQLGPAKRKNPVREDRVFLKAMNAGI